MAIQANRRGLRRWLPMVVEPSESFGVLMLATNAFLLMMAYYILKTVREPLILQGGGYGVTGEELKTYATAGQAVLLLGLVPLYCRVARSIDRRQLIRRTVGFVIASLLAFMLLSRLQVRIGLAYYLWLGAVSLIAIAQFWSFANDIYRRTQGERLIPVIAVGASLGALLGAGTARWLLEQLGLHLLMLLAAAVLALYAALYRIIDPPHRPAGQPISQDNLPLGSRGGFQLVLKNRYLLLIAFTVLLSSLVNTHGEYVLADAVNAHAEALAPAGDVAQRRLIVGEAYGNFYSAVNLLALVIQLLLVAPLFRHLGIHRALYVFPLIALAAYGSMAAAPAFMLIASAKTAENATDYSLNNSVRHTLFLPTTRAEKYKAKAAIEAFFLRFGDLIAGGTVFAGVHLLHLSARQFALVNVGLIAVWLTVVPALARRYRQLGSEGGQRQQQPEAGVGAVGDLEAGGRHRRPVGRRRFVPT
jgi:ATP:ADP antiporter, AAA family